MLLTLALLGGSASALFLLTASARLSPRSSAAACASRNLVATPLPEPSLRALSPCDSPVRGRAWTTRQPTCTTAPWPDECGACNVQHAVAVASPIGRTLCLRASVRRLRSDIRSTPSSSREQAVTPTFLDPRCTFLFCVRCVECVVTAAQTSEDGCESVKPARGDAARRVAIGFVDSFRPFLGTSASAARALAAKV